jgi:transposase InsO family protein
LTDAVAALAPDSGIMAAACAALGVSRASVQRRRARLAAPLVAFRPRPRPARALTGPQQQAVLDLLHAPRVEPRGSPGFADQAPAEIYASLLDEGVHHCSVRTMYRLPGQNSEVRERRAQLRHPAYQKPELLAKRPNEVWSWDITKLMGPAKWSYFYLYVTLDIFSRRVVG